MLFSFLFLFAAFGLGATLPLRWGARGAGNVLLALAIFAFSEPVPYDPDWGYDLLRTWVIWLTGALLTGVALRGIIHLAKGDNAPPGPQEAVFLAGADLILQGLVGVLIGCPTFQLLAILLQGSPGGLALHLWVAGIAVVIIFALAFTRLRAVAAGAGLVVAALALDGGLRYPDLILTEAARYRPAQPRCLMLGPALLPPQTRADLMALTMAKDSTGPSDALLLVQTDSAPRLLRWSFRARRFVQAPALTEARPLCTPTTAALLPD